MRAFHRRRASPVSGTLDRMRRVILAGATVLVVVVVLAEMVAVLAYIQKGNERSPSEIKPHHHAAARASGSLYW